MHRWLESDGFLMQRIKARTSFDTIDQPFVWPLSFVLMPRSHVYRGLEQALTVGPRLDKIVLFH